MKKIITAALDTTIKHPYITFYTGILFVGIAFGTLAENVRVLETMKGVAYEK